MIDRQQYNPQTHFGFQSLNTGQFQYPFPVFNQQVPFLQPNPSQINHINAMDGSVRRPTEADLVEKIKKKLEQRRISKKNWFFYTKAPESWYFNDTAPSRLHRGIEVVMLSPNMTTPS